MADLENSSELLKQALDELRKSGMLTATTLDKLNKALISNTKATDNQTQAADEAAKKLAELKQTVGSVAKSIGAAAQGARENREDFRSLSPAVDAAATTLKFLNSRIGDGISALGGFISGIGAVAPGLGKILIGVGAGVSSFGEAYKKHGKEAVDAAAAFAKFSLEEIQRVVGAYQELSKVGGVTARTFGGLQEDAAAMGLSMDQYAKLIARNAEGLAMVGGSVTSGAKAVKDITVASKEFEDQFLKLGIGFTEQRELTAKFLSFQRLNTQINLQDTKALAQANKNYIETVDEITRLTGQSRDKVAADMEAASRELRYGATVQLAEMSGTTKELFKAEKMMAQLGPQALEGFKDIFGGPTTQRSIELQIATGGAAAQLAQDLKEGRIDAVEFMRRMRDATVQFRGNAKEAAILEERTGKLGQAYESMMPASRILSNLTDEQIRSGELVKQEQQEAGAATDANTKKIVDAQKGLRDFAVEVDKLAIKLFPALTTATETLVNAMVAGAQLLNKVFGKTGGGGTVPTTNREPITGAQVNERRVAAGQAPLPPEAAETQAGRETVERGLASRNLRRRMRAGDKGAVEQGLKMLNLKSGEATAGGEADPRLVAMAMQIQEMFPNAQFTALNDLYHQRNHPNSKHAIGKALDMTLSPAPANAQEAAAIKDQLRSLGFSKVLDEYFADRNRYTTGGHFHAELAQGGIVSGPRSGYASLLHGTEAVVPLPGGRSIPVEMTGMTDKMGEQVSMLTAQTSMLADIVDLMRSSVSTQEKIYRATAS